MIRHPPPEKHTMRVGDMTLDVSHELWIDPDNRAFLKRWWGNATAALRKQKASEQ